MFTKVKNLRFFEYEKVNPQDNGVIMETFFDFHKKKAKSINQLSKKENISVTVPKNTFFMTSPHNKSAIKEMKEGNNLKKIF